jgi:hypothetical protein
MRFRVVLVGLLVSACFAPVNERADGSAGGSAAGGQAGGAAAGGSAGGVAGGTAGGSAGGGATSCVSDTQCGAGQRCYACGTRSLCAEGCSGTKPCPGQACVEVDIACLTCPCPDSRCVTPSCADEDGDGYAVLACPGLRGGDCRPLDATVNPGAVERCDNGKDDDCNGVHPVERARSRAVSGVRSTRLAATGGSATRRQRVSARRCRRLHSVVRLDVATDAAPPCLAAGGPVDDDWRRGGAPRTRRCGRGWHSRPRPPAGPQGLLRRRRAVAPGRVRGLAARVVAAPLADGAASLSSPTPRRGGPFASPSTPTPPSTATTDRASSDW